MADVADHFKGLRNAYRGTFCSDKGGDLHPLGKQVIDNLRQLTKHGQSPFNSDPVAMAYAVGQQDVFRHVMQMLNITDADIYRLTASQRANGEEGLFGNDY